MLSWSNARYKLTLGVGSLAIAGMLSELGQNVLPVWSALAIVLLPLVVFVFIHPGELPVRLVEIAHAIASVWYVIVAAALLLVMLLSARPLPRGWLLYPLFAAIGAMPCSVVLYRAIRGRYESSKDSENGNADSDARPQDQDHCLDRLVLKNSRWQYLLLLLASLGFVAAGVFILAMGKSPLAGWSTIVFFGPCALIFIWQIVDARPRLIIDESGILDRTLGVGEILWSNIEGAYVQSIAGNDFICLILRDPETYAERLSLLRRAMTTANRSLGFTDFSINLSGVDVRTEEIFELVIKRIATTQMTELSAMATDESRI